MLKENIKISHEFMAKTDEFILSLKEMGGFDDDVLNLGSISMALHKLKELPYDKDIVRNTLEDAVLDANEHTPYSISEKFVELYPSRIVNIGGELIEIEDLETKDDIWYQYSTFCTHMLPQTKTNKTELTTKYPNHSLSIECVKGLPYGGIARLIVLYVNSIAVKYRSQEVEIGKTIKEFVENLGYTASYKPGGSNEEVMEQIEKLFHSTFVLSTITKTNQPNNGLSVERKDVRFHLFDGKISVEDIRADLTQKVTAKLKLSDDYFKELLAHPVPLSFEALKAMRRSPLAMDLYAFIAYRANGNRLIAAKLEALKLQFGFEGPTWRFKEQLLRAITYVEKAWPECRLIVKKDVLIIPRLSTHISQR